MLPLTHCDRAPTRQASQAQFDELAKSLRSAWDRADAPGELKKLQQLQYKVVELPDSPEEAEKLLNELGADRWDCWHATERLEDSIKRLRVFCKRGVETPLRLIPRAF